MGFGLSSIGKILNNVTGATSAAKQQNAYQKEAAQNQVQWRAQDLEKAGFNRALAATEGATAGGFGGAPATSGVNPIDLINSIVGMENQTSATEAQNGLLKAQTMQIIEMLPFQKDEKLRIIQELTTRAGTNVEQSKYLRRKASGKGGDIKIGNKFWNAGGSFHW